MSKTRENKIEKIIGRKICDLRILEGWTREQLSRHIGVSPQQLYKYENGTSKISISRLIPAAKAFGKPLSYFIDNYNEASERDNISESQRLALELSFNFTKIKSSRIQEAVNELIKSIREEK